MPGTCDVDGVTLLLVQEMVYTCNLGEGEDERMKKEVLVVSDDHDTSDADPGETKIYDKLKLKVNDSKFNQRFPEPNQGFGQEFELKNETKSKLEK